MEKTTAGRAIVEIMKQEGVRCVFGLPGGHILNVYDGLYDTPSIKHVLVRHEQTAANMAAAYAQLTGEPGICIVTAGPGATNLVTGVAEAFIGCWPMVIFAARATAANAHRGAAQEVSTEKVFAPITKWAVRVDRADLIPEVTRQAFRIARSGKPGPVYIDLPRDLLPLEVPVPAWPAIGKPQQPGGNPEAISAAVDALLAAKKPIIVAGGGAVASDAQKEIAELAESLAVPVLTSLSGRGSISDDHPLSSGGLGCHRNDLSGRLLEEADYVLGLGTRFEEMETNWRPGFVPSPDAFYVQVDLDPNEMGRSVVPRIPIVGDVALVAGAMAREIKARGKALDKASFEKHPRIAEIKREVVAIEAAAAEIGKAGRVPLHSLAVIQQAREAFPRDTVVAIDVGCLAQHMAGAFPFFKIFEPRSLITPSSFYGMGFAASGLPAAKLVYPDRPALGFVGDGSFQMVMAVLPVAAEHKLPVTWCILNDDALGSIRDIQEYAFGERYLGTDFEFQPDFAKLAESCGCYGERVEAQQQVAGAFQRAVEANKAGKPAVLDFACGKDRLKQTTDFYWFYQTKKTP